MTDATVRFSGTIDGQSVFRQYRLQDGLNNVRLNGDKITSSEYFAREPRRLEFELLHDNWLQQYMLTGQNEWKKCISRFEVALDVNGHLWFSGIINMMFTEFDYATRVVKFICYDKLRLITLSEGEIDFSQNGYEDRVFINSGIITLMLTRVSAFFGLPTTPSYQVTANVPTLYRDSYPFFTLPLTDIRQASYIDFSSTDNAGATYSDPDFKYGYYQNNGRIGFFIYREGYYTKGLGTDARERRLGVGRRWEIFNNLCPEEPQDSDFSHDTGWYEPWDMVDEQGQHVPEQELMELQEALNEWFGTFGQTASGPHETYFVQDNRTWAVSQAFGPNTTSPTRLTLTGNLIPAGISPAQTSMNPLSLFKAALMLWNLTTLSQPDGTLVLSDKNSESGAEIFVDWHDLVGLKRRRDTFSTPTLSTLTALRGDTTALQAAMAEYYRFDPVWQLEITLDNLKKYDLHLFDNLTINDNISTKRYRIYELKPNLIRDCWEIVAWEL